MKTGTILAIVVLVLFALFHLIRLIGGTEILIGGNIIPAWVSVVGVILPVLIVWLLWKESK